jgi:hypothetical protein
VTGDRMARYYIWEAALKLSRMVFDFISVSLAIYGCFPVPLNIDFFFAFGCFIAIMTR